MPDFFEQLIRAGDEKQNTEFYLATVSTVSDANGVTFTLDGQSSATTKAYKTLLTGNELTAGDRIVVMKHSGTYVVLGAIGNPEDDLKYTTTFSDIATATASFTAGTTYFVKTGRVASIYVQGTWATTQSSSAETTAFTMKTGYRPLITTSARAWRNVNSILYANGNMTFTGTFSSGGGVTFLATYICE